MLYLLGGFALSTLISLFYFVAKAFIVLIGLMCLGGSLYICYALFLFCVMVVRHLGGKL